MSYKFNEDEKETCLLYTLKDWDFDFDDLWDIWVRTSVRALPDSVVRNWQENQTDKTDKVWRDLQAEKYLASVLPETNEESPQLKTINRTTFDRFFEQSGTNVG